MAEPKHKIPNAGQILTDENRASPSWNRYWGGIEELSTRLDGIDDTTGSESLAQLITKVQEILDAYKTE